MPRTPPINTTRLSGTRASPTRPWLLLLLALAVIAYLATWPLRARRPEDRSVSAPFTSSPAAAEATIRAELATLQQQVRGTGADGPLFVRMASLFAALGEPKQARYALEAARRAAPQDAGVAAAIGVAYREQRLYDRAIEEWRRALRRAPENTALALELATLYMSLGWSAEARALLEEARRRAPEDPGVRIALAMQQVQNARTREAEAHLKAAQRLAPENERVDSLLAHLYDLEGRPREALAAIRRALARSPEEPDYQIQLGDLLLTAPAPSPREAEAAYRRALARSPGDPRALIGLARALRRQERLPEAAEVLTPIQAHSRPDPTALRELGQLQVRLGRAAEGRATLARADRLAREAEALDRARLRVAMRPGAAELRRQLGALYMEQGDAPRAIVELKRVLSERPGDRTARSLLAEALRRAGRAEEIPAP